MRIDRGLVEDVFVVLEALRVERRTMDKYLAPSVRDELDRVTPLLMNALRDDGPADLNSCECANGDIGDHLRGCPQNPDSAQQEAVGDVMVSVVTDALNDPDFSQPMTDKEVVTAWREGKHRCEDHNGPCPHWKDCGCACRSCSAHRT
jgi:hypothetical protein